MHMFLVVGEQGISDHLSEKVVLGAIENTSHTSPG